MTYSPRIKAIKPRDAKAFQKAKSGRLELEVELESGPRATILVETPDQVGAQLKKGRTSFSFGRPVLFVRKLDEETVGGAVSAMAEELSGYWLRFYDR